MKLRASLMIGLLALGGACSKKRPKAPTDPETPELQEKAISAEEVQRLSPSVLIARCVRLRRTNDINRSISAIAAPFLKKPAPGQFDLFTPALRLLEHKNPNIRHNGIWLLAVMKTASRNMAEEERAKVAPIEKQILPAILRLRADPNLVVRSRLATVLSRFNDDEGSVEPLLTLGRDPESLVRHEALVSMLDCYALAPDRFRKAAEARLKDQDKDVRRQARHLLKKQ